MYQGNRMSIHDIRLDAYYVHRTWAGCYEGRPDNEHQFVVDSARKRCAKIYGEHRPILVHPPAMEAPTPSGIRTHMAWLDGPADWEINHGTHLVVIWFDCDIPQNPLYAALEIVNKHGGWEANAKGYEI